MADIFLFDMFWNTL